MLWLCVHVCAFGAFSCLVVVARVCVCVCVTHDPLLFVTGRFCFLYTHASPLGKHGAIARVGSHTPMPSRWGVHGALVCPILLCVLRSWNEAFGKAR